VQYLAINAILLTATEKLYVATVYFIMMRASHRGNIDLRDQEQMIYQLDKHATCEHLHIHTRSFDHEACAEITKDYPLFHTGYPTTPLLP
jgi:hypothetical protein